MTCKNNLHLGGLQSFTQKQLKSLNFYILIFCKSYFYLMNKGLQVSAVEETAKKSHPLL